MGKGLLVQSTSQPTRHQRGVRVPTSAAHTRQDAQGLGPQDGRRGKRMAATGDSAAKALELLAAARKASGGEERAAAVRDASLLLLGSGAASLQQMVPALTEFLVRP